MKKIIKVLTLVLCLALLVLAASCDRNKKDPTQEPTGGEVIEQPTQGGQNDPTQGGQNDPTQGGQNDPTQGGQEEEKSYTISIDSNIQNGKISTSRRSGKAGLSVIVTVTPDEGYELVPGSLKANGVEIVNGTFDIPAENVTVTAAFQLKAYSVTVGAVEHGTVTVSSATAKMGETVTITVTPDADYLLDRVYVNGVVSPLTFTMGAEDAVVTATFEYHPIGDTFGDLSDKLATSGFDTSTDKGEDAYVIQSGGEQQYVFVKDLWATDFVFTTKINAISVLNDDQYPRFGIAVYNPNNTIYFNVEASRLENTSVHAVTGTLGTGAWDWGRMHKLDATAANYSGEGYVELTVIKSGEVIYFLVNGELANVMGGYSGLGAEDKATIALLTMNINAKFYDYSYSTDAEELAQYALDYDLEDLSWLEDTTSVSMAGTEEYEGKGVEFYGKLAEEGLYLAAIAQHGIYIDSASEWWLNTNFEVFLNGGNQFFVSAAKGSYPSKNAIVSLETVKAEGAELYTSTAVIFIPKGIVSQYIQNNSVRVGFAWKTVGDICNNGNDGTSEYWLIPGHGANNAAQQYVVNANGIKEYNPIQYLVTAGQLTNGSVAASVEKGLEGTEVTLTVTPAAGYELVPGSLKANGVAVVDNKFLIGEENVTITAEFQLKTLNVTVGETLNGTLAVSSATAKMGDTITITATPAAGYVLGGVYVNGKESELTFVMGSEDAVITAEFIEEDKTYYAITVAEVIGGSVEASKRNALEGEEIIITATPALGYELVSLKANGVDVVENKITVGTEAVEVVAVFQLKTYNVSIETSENGQITVSSATAKMGDVITITVVANRNYVLDKIYVNGEESELTFTMGAEDVLVAATYKYAPSGDTLGSLANKEMTGGFDLGTDNGEDAYILQTGSDQQYVFFKDLWATDFIVTTRVSAKSVLNGDAFPRFGLAVYNANTTVYLNVEASNLTNDSVHVVTGTLGTGSWDWERMHRLDRGAGSYSGDDYVELTIVKAGDVLYFAINGELANVMGGFAGLGAEDKASVAFVTMNIEAKYYDYACSTDPELIADFVLPVDVTDLSWMNDVTTHGFAGSGEFEGKGVTYYGKLTEEGLYLGAVAKHSLYINNAGQWWQNTNFEVFVNGGTQFFYSAGGNGFPSKNAIGYHTVVKNGDLYTTTAVIFIPAALIPNYNGEEQVRAGFAWKTLGDVINNSGGIEREEWWFAPGHGPNDGNQQYYIDSEGIRETAVRHYNVAVDELVNGAVVPSSSNAEKGSEISLTVTPNKGYELVPGSLKVNGVAVVDNKFELTENAVVTAEFQLVTYKISVGEVLNGSVSVDVEEGNIGDVVTITAVADENYAISGVYLNGVLYEGGLTFTIDAEDVEVTVTFISTLAPTYNVTIAQLANGSVVPSISVGEEGTEVVLTVTPDAGYELVSLKANGVDVVDGKFNLGAEDVEITAEFQLKTLNITVENPSHLTLDVQETAKMGDEVTVAVTADEDYSIDKLYVNGVESALTFSMPATDVEITATYKVTPDGSLNWIDGLDCASIIGTGNFNGKSVKFYGLLTAEGLWLGAVADHSRFVSDAGEWWNNTNFEFFLDGGNQRYFSVMNGGTPSAGVVGSYQSSKVGDLHHTVIECFLPMSEIQGYVKADGIRVGFAWKTNGDEINNGNNRVADYWVPFGQVERDYNQQFVITEAGLVDNVTPHTGGFNVEGYATGAPITQTGTDQQFAILKELWATDFVATTKVSAKSIYKDDAYPKFGFAIHSTDNTYFLAVDAVGLRDKGMFVIPGKVGGDWDWGNMFRGTDDASEYSGDNYIELTIIKKAATIYFLVDGKITYIKNNANGFGASDKATVAFLTMNIEAVYYDYSFSTDEEDIAAYAQVNAMEDTSWLTAATKAGEVVGTDEFAGKGIEFYGKLAPEGLYLAAVAKHSNYVTTEGEWHRNTNFEIFVDGGRQFFYSVRQGGQTMHGCYARTVYTYNEETHLYETTTVMFIPRGHIEGNIHDDVIKVGFAWKTPGDQCNNGNDGTSEYWLIPSHPANNGDAQFVVGANGIVR